MIAGYHLIFGAYGFWLPNDPRGSWSNFVGSWELFRHGPATRTSERRSLAWDAHDRQKRLVAKQSLQRAPVEFTGLQARAVARGFAAYVGRSGLKVWACAIMPDHVHLALGRAKVGIEQVAIQLKGFASRQLRAEGLHPFADQETPDGRTPKCFARGAWKVFLDPDDVGRAIRYVHDNPLKEGMRAQRWNFVTEP